MKCQLFQQAQAHPHFTSYPLNSYLGLLAHPIAWDSYQPRPRLNLRPTKVGAAWLSLVEPSRASKDVSWLRLKSFNSVLMLFNRFECVSSCSNDSKCSLTVLHCFSKFLWFHFVLCFLMILNEFYSLLQMSNVFLSVLCFSMIFIVFK